MSNLSKRLNETIKFPTTLIVNGLDVLGVELAKMLLEQGGFVIIADDKEKFDEELAITVSEFDNLLLLDIESLSEIEHHGRRLDYIYYLNYTYLDIESQISAKTLFNYSKVFDYVIKLSLYFESKLLLCTSIPGSKFIVETGSTPSIDNLGATKLNRAEIQKYLESLALEYKERESLDLRIVRVGILLGDGVDVAQDMFVYKSTKDAILHEKISIPGDGLRSDFYVHLKDAAYGLVKAMFSKNSNGETFSLAYEYDISNLAIAYKIAEMAGIRSNVEFTDELEENTSRINLYRPSPNLMRIGWKPKIEFEKALSTMFDYLKREFKDISRTDFVNKSNNHKNGVGNTPLSKKIVEKAIDFKNLDEKYDKSASRVNSLLKKTVSSNSELRRSRFLKRIDNFFAQISFLKNITISEFLSSFLILILLAFLYIYFISPAIFYFNVRNDLLKNINRYETTPREQITARENIKDTISDNLADLEKIGARYKQIFEFVGYPSNRFSEVLDFSGSTEEIAIQDSEVNFVLENYSNYLNWLNPQIIYTQSANSLIFPENIQTNTEFNSFNIDKQTFDSARLNLADQQTNFGALPEWPDTKLVNDIAKYRAGLVMNLETSLGSVTSVEVLDSLVGSVEQQNILLVLVDDSSLQPSSGIPISGFVLDTEKGALKAIKTLDFNELLTNSSVNPALFSDINFTDTIGITSRFNPYFESSGENYLGYTKEVVEQETGSEIDLVISLNSEALRKLLGIVGNVQYREFQFNQSNLYSNLAIISGAQNNSISEKNNILTNLLALVIRQTFNNLEENLGQLSEVIISETNNKNIIILDSGIDLDIPFSASDKQIDEALDFIDINLINLNGGVGAQGENINLEITNNILDDFETEKEINITGINSNVESVLVCIPASSFDIELNNLQFSSQSLELSNNRTCLVLNGVGERLDFEFKTLSVGSLPGVSDEYKLLVRKQPNISINLDYQANVADISSYSAFPEKFVLNTGAESVEFNGFISNDFEFELIKD